MIQFLFLDSSPLSLLTHPQSSLRVHAISAWLFEAVQSGIQVIVPAIIFYELKRELLRASKPMGMARLDAFVSAGPGLYLPLSDPALRLATDLWAQSRRAGRPTGPPESLDIDVLLAAQALTFGPAPSEIVVVTANRKHLSQFVDARDWTEIYP